MITVTIKQAFSRDSNKKVVTVRLDDYSLHSDPLEYEQAQILKDKLCKELQIHD